MGKRFFVTTLLFYLFSIDVAAQSGKLPPFGILLTNGTVFKAESLPNEKPVIIIYFSPDCEHCLVLSNAFFKRAADFNTASVVMVTVAPVEKVAQYAQHYGIDRFPNIRIGTERNTFFLRNYYKLSKLPFAALYDRNGNFVHAYTEKIPLDDLLSRLKKLK